MWLKHSLIDFLGAWRGELPRGCKWCRAGLKVSIFITGSCDEECYYCPISLERRKPNAFYVDEEYVTSLDIIIEEVEAIGAKGASITGGEPLLYIDKVLEVIEHLKSYFGSQFHIHLYTNGNFATLDTLKALDKVGLDEIRFHPVRKESLKNVEFATKHTSMDVGIEIPAIPSYIKWIKDLATFLEKIQGKFLNINELEVTETNIENLRIRGFEVREDAPALKGSKETAIEIISWAERMGLSITIHFCPARLKDLIQTRLRLLRKAISTVPPYASLTAEGTLKFVVVEAKEKVSILDNLVALGLGIKRGNKYYFHLEAIPYLKPIKSSRIVEVYPFLRKPTLVVEETPLNT